MKSIDIELKGIENVNLAGYGGKEADLEKIFTRSKGWIRKSESYYDFYNVVTGQKVETKKQQSQQWLDPSKYAELKEDQKDILVVFFCYGKKQKGIDLVYSVKSEDIAKIWPEELKKAALLVREISNGKCQMKYSLSTRKFYRENQNIVETLYKV